MFAGVICCILERRLMQTRWSIGNTFRTYNRSNLVVKSVLMLVPGLLLLAMFLTTNIISAHAQAIGICTSNDITYAIKTGDTLNKIATRYHTTSSALATHNSVANPDLIYAGRTLCVPQRSSVSNSTVTQHPAANISTNVNQSQQPAMMNTANNASVGSGNPYPYGQCTWWADERYHELHGVYVPWTSNSDAWQWTTRAEQFGWHVSSTPSIGDIIDLQPDVQGAYNLGHVAVVEQVLSSNEVIASSMNWGADPMQVTDFQFTSGAGVTFIHQ